MKHISVIVPAGECVLSSVIGTYKLFETINRFYAQSGQPRPFEVELVGIKPETVLYNGAFNIKPHKMISEIEKTDLVVVTTINGDLPLEIENNKAFIPWIGEHYAKGAEVASLCLGAFLLASTGLLDGKSCTTHWMGADAFRQMFPHVELLDEKIITDQKGVYSSGGAYSFLNLVLYLIEKYCGREIALQAAKLFEVDIDRYSQSEFAIFTGQKEHEDTSVKQAQLFIEQNYSQKIGVELLAEKYAISRRNFIRRFKKATNNTPIEYIQRVKIEAAKKALELGVDGINDVMYSIGYSDTKAFRNLFRKYTGMTPTDYRSKYSRYFSRAVA